MITTGYCSLRLILENQQEVGALRYQIEIQMVYIIYISDWYKLHFGSSSAYAGYFIGPSLFLIIKEADSFFEVYQGERDKGILNVYKFDLADKRLSSLFSGTKHDEIIYDVQSKKLEFNISTMSAYKMLKNQKKS